MQESEKYTNPGFQVNNEAIEPNGRDPTSPYYLTTSEPPQQAPNCYPGFPQSMAYGVEGSFNQQPASPVMVMASPSEGNGPQPQHRSYLYFSIFNLLCCCWPLGIYALQASLKARSCANQNDPDGAAYHGTKALRWNISALVIGIISQIGLAVYLYFTYLHK